MNDNTPVFQPPEKTRALYLTLYDLQGGPLSERAKVALEQAASEIAEEYGLAINSVVV
jgi:hypothetical protein